MKYIIALLVATMTLVTGSAVRAQATGEVPPVPPVPTAQPISAPAPRALLEEGRAKAEALKREIEVKKMELKVNLDAKKLELKKLASTTRGELKDQRQEVRGEIMDKRDEFRKEASTTRGEIKDKRDEFRKEASTTRAEIKQDVKDRAAKRLGETVTNATRQLNQAISRLEEIKAKIDSRITKFAEKGVDVTLARADLLTASFKIDQAKTAVSAISGVVVSTTDPKTSLESLKTVVETAKKAVEDAHRALVNTVENFKPAVGRATTTESNR